MYRISVTSLEKFRRFRDGASSYDTEESLIETLSGQFKGNAYTQIGTAFHSIVELGEQAYKYKYGESVFTVVSDGVDVRMDQAQIFTALAYRYSMPGAFYEIKLGKDFDTPSFPIHVGGRADVILGAQVRDIKTKYSTPKMDDYVASCQWRLYLEILEADQFFFDVFEFRGYDKEKHGIDVRDLTVVPFEPVECIRYADMERDNQALVSEFCAYIEYRKLHHLLKIKEA